MMSSRTGNKSIKAYVIYSKFIYMLVPLMVGLLLLTGIVGVVSIQAASIDESRRVSPGLELYEPVRSTETLRVGTNAEYWPFDFTAALKSSGGIST